MRCHFRGRTLRLFPMLFASGEHVRQESRVVIQQANRIKRFAFIQKALDSQIVGGSESKILVAGVNVHRREFLAQVCYRAVGAGVVGNGDNEMLAVLELHGHVA